MILLTTSYCVPCKGVKKYIETNNLNVQILDLTSPEGVALAREKGVRSVPTLITDISTLVGAENIINHLGEYVE